VTGLRRVVPCVLTRDECRQTIAAAEAKGFEGMGPRYPGGYRNNDRALLDDKALAARLFDRLRPHLPAEYGDWRLEGLNSRFRFCRYREGQQFTKHRDGAWAPSADERSWLTVMLYLNDAGEFVGGATRFFDDAPESIAPREGQAIVFDHRQWHDGEAVTKGVKYVMRTDVMYRRQGAGKAVEAATSGQLHRAKVVARHHGYVWAVKVLADGGIASGSRDCTVRRDGQLLRTTEGSVTALVEVEGRLWTGGRHGRLEDGERSWQAHRGAVLGLAREADGTVVSSGADGRAMRWSPRGELLESRRVEVVWDAGAVTEGAEGHRDGRLRVGKTWQAHQGAVTAVIQLGGGAWVSAGEDGAVRLWTAEGVLLGEGRHDDFVRCLARVDGDHFVSGSYDGTVVLWRVSGTGGMKRQAPASDH